MDREEGVMPSEDGDGEVVGLVGVRFEKGICRWRTSSLVVGLEIQGGVVLLMLVAECCWSC